MTFDFAPAWMAQLLTESPMSAPSGLLLGQAPPYPDAAETARLVSELFAEGALSPEQLRSFKDDPEISGRLPLGLMLP
jgi:hypothetical protein